VTDIYLLVGLELSANLALMGYSFCVDLDHTAKHQ